MKMKNLFLLLSSVTLLNSAIAVDTIESQLKVSKADYKVEAKSKNNIFKKIGEFAKIDFKPQNSKANFIYDVYYYIPKNISTKTNLNTLVFMHGGGASTSDRAGSTRVINMYKNDLMTLADTLGFILVMPSGSGQNWGGHLLSYFKDLNEVIRKDLPVNKNKIALSGHSMGAMGITRSAHWLADEYSFFMPMAGGIQDNYNVPKYLSTYFNTNYYHIQGLKDHFQIFVERSKKQKENIEALELEYGKKSGFGLEFYNGGHNYDLVIFADRLKEKFKNTSRNLYQKELYPIFYNRDEVIVDQWSNGNEYYLAPRDRYFWLKAIDFYTDKVVIDGTAKINDNKININLAEGVKTLRVYLSSKLVDMNKAVEITVNNKVMSNEVPKVKTDSVESQRDASFVFESYVDIQL